MVFLCRPPCCGQSHLFDGQPGQPPPSAVTPLSPAFLWPQRLGPELSRTVQEGPPQISSVEPFVFNLLRHSPKTSVSSVRKAVRFQVPFSGPSLLTPLETDSELPQSTTFLLSLFLDSMSPLSSSLSLSLTLTSSSSDASSLSQPTTGGGEGRVGGGGTGRGGGRGGTHQLPPGDMVAEANIALQATPEAKLKTEITEPESPKVTLLVNNGLVVKTGSAQSPPLFPSTFGTTTTTKLAGSQGELPQTTSQEAPTPDAKLHMEPRDCGVVASPRRLVLGSCSSPELASPEGSASQLDNLAAKVQGLETELAEVRREVTQINSRLDALFDLIRTRIFTTYRRMVPLSGKIGSEANGEKLETRSRSVPKNLRSQSRQRI